VKGKGKPKYYVLDTNVLLHNPDAIFAFQENHLIIPITVIEEIDKFKRDMSDIGRNARAASRNLDLLKANGKLSNGVDLPNGGTLRVDLADPAAFGDIPGFAFNGSPDMHILAVALAAQKKHQNSKVILVTKDTNLRIKADALNLDAEDFESQKVNMEELYTGYVEILVPRGVIDGLFENGEVEIENHQIELFPNQCLQLIDETDSSHTALARIQANGHTAIPIKRLKGPIYNISPRNREQRFALELLLDDKVQLVTLVGKAGTGKTLLAIAAGLNKVLQEEVYQRLVVTRPIYPLGRDLGFLPGDLEAKLRPWMQPIFDNLELLLADPKDKAARYTKLNELINLGVIELEALTYIRGRSIPNQYLIIDESQNLTPHEIKTVVTRVGEGSKIVLTGDPYQIDNPYLDSSSNGLTYLVEHMKGQQLAGHVTLIKGERSSLAELAANLL